MLLVFASSVLLLVACSGGDDATPSSPTYVATPTVVPVTAAALCASAVEGGETGTVASPDITELSGLAVSRTQDVIWAHNDSGDTARVFAMAANGAALATYDLVGADAFDWEDMAIGPGPDGNKQYLYLADIGDNASIRPSVTVYRTEEPKFGALDSSLAIDRYEAMLLMYPDGAHDAETLLVDPMSGDLYIVTKDIRGGPSGVYRAVTIGVVPGVLEKVAEVDFGALPPSKVIPPGSGPLPLALGKIPTGGDISPDGNMIALRTYGTIWMWQRPEGGTIADAFASPPCEAPSAVETQGEAIAFTTDGRGYVTASEGANSVLHRFEFE